MGTVAAERMQPIFDEITSKDRAPLLDWADGREGAGVSRGCVCVCGRVGGCVRVPGGRWGGDTRENIG